MPLLQARGIDYQLLLTDDPEDACNRMCEAAASQNVESFAVIGGDGTVHGVLPALLKTRLPLGIIPAGSGNDFARALGIPSDAEKALAVILAGQIMELDCLESFGRPVATVVGVGLDAAVAARVNRSRLKRWLGRLQLGSIAYVFSLLQVLITYRARDVRIEIDGEIHEFRRVWLLAAANTPYYGGGMKICPAAAPNDRLLNVCVVHRLSRFGLLRAFPQVYEGSHVHHPRVQFLQGRRLTVEAIDRELLAHGDGEIIGMTPAQITLHGTQLRVMAPDRSSRHERPDEKHSDLNTNQGANV